MNYRLTLTLLSLAVVAAGCNLQPALQNDQQNRPVVRLEQLVYFQSPDGNDVVARPDLYHIEASEGSRLRLTPVTGASSLTVQAVESPHDLPVKSNFALVVPHGEDEEHVLLLTPDGKGLDAVGSRSGIHGRGALSTLTATRINKTVIAGAVAAIKTAPTVTLSPAQGPSGTMVKITVSNFPLPPPQFSQMREAEVRIDNMMIQKVNLLPCSNGTLGLGEDCKTPPLTFKFEGPLGGKRYVSVETDRNILLGSPYASATFTIEVAPSVGQTQIAPPVLTLAYPEGPPGSFVETGACGFPANLIMKSAKLTVDGRLVGTPILGRCPDGSGGFGIRVPGGAIPELMNRVMITMDGPPGPKTLQAQVDGNPAPPGIATFIIGAVPPIAISPRFQLIQEGPAVLDKETGLTWERAPSEIANQSSSFEGGRSGCRKKTLANRLGWRLPTLDELASLVDAGQRGPALPAGHPFALPQGTTTFWTTTNEWESSSVYVVDMWGGGIKPLPKAQIGSFGAWCVRGISGPEKQ